MRRIKRKIIRFCSINTYSFINFFLVTALLIYKLLIFLLLFKNLKLHKNNRNVQSIWIIWQLSRNWYSTFKTKAPIHKYSQTNFIRPLDNIKKKLKFHTNKLCDLIYLMVSFSSIYTNNNCMLYHAKQANHFVAMRNLLPIDLKR